jgi:hypothetical protein
MIETLEKFKKPCADFIEAQSKGIVELDPLFEINGVPFYTFCKGLTMLSAERFLQYQENVRFWSSIGLSKEVSSDYINEAIDKIEDIRKSADDPRMTLRACDEVLVTLRVYEEHKKNFNIAGAMLELCALALINPCESPYKTDFEHNTDKIKLMSAAMDAPNGEEFTLFFWKLSSLGSMDWVQRLMDFTPYWAKEESQMTDTEKSQFNLSRNLLILDILKSKEALEGLQLGKGSSLIVRSYRTILNLVKEKSNVKVFSIISTTKNL